MRWQRLEQFPVYRECSLKTEDKRIKREDDVR
jgi:hypothetical protein